MRVKTAEAQGGNFSYVEYGVVDLCPRCFGIRQIHAEVARQEIFWGIGAVVVAGVIGYHSSWCSGITVAFVLLAVISGCAKAYRRKRQARFDEQLRQQS
jgi:hypothetical protein